MQEKHMDIKNLYMDDPTVMGFNLYIDINDYNSPLFTEQNIYGSAIQYLKRVQEQAKAMYLTEFKYRLRDLITMHPYFLQSVSGLNEIFKYNPKETWRGKDKVLKFKTLESIDLRMGNMIDKYNRATFDEDYMREMLPINLRKFNCYLVVSEIRNFKTFYNTVVTGGDDTNVQVLNDFLSCWVFKFEGCRFDFSESNPWMETINNGRPDTPSENGFNIVFDRVVERHKMNIIDAYSGVQAGTPEKDLDRYVKGVDGQNTYRKTQWGAPKTGDFQKIKQVEQQLQNQPGETTFLKSLGDFVMSQPEIKKMQADFDPTVLQGRVENLALDQVRGVLGQAVLGNVFDVKNTLFSTDVVLAIKNKLDQLNDKPLNESLDMGGRTAYNNQTGNVGQDGRTVYNNQNGAVASDPRTVQNTAFLGDDDNTPLTLYPGSQGLVSVDNPSIYTGPMGIITVDPHSPINTGSIGDLGNVGHAADLNPQTLTGIYGIQPGQVGGLGSDFVQVHNIDFFRTFLGNVGTDRPFSNLLQNLVGGVIPNLIKRELNIT